MIIIFGRVNSRITKHRKFKEQDVKAWFLAGNEK